MGGDREILEAESTGASGGSARGEPGGAAWSRVFTEEARAVAGTSDEWFVSALVALGRCGPWLRTKLGRLRRRRSFEERIRASLRDEARHRRLDVSEEEFALFSEQMATLLELVLSGKIQVHDIAFETSSDAPHAPTPGPTTDHGGGR